MHPQVPDPKIERMFSVMQKAVFSVKKQNLTPMESMVELINALSNDVFVSAVRDCGYAMTRYLERDLRAHNDDAKKAITGCGDFVAEILWYHVLDAANIRH